MTGRHRAPHHRRRPRALLLAVAAGVLLGTSATCAVWRASDELVHCADGPILPLNMS